MTDREVRVAPQIYRSRKGWRVYIRQEGERKAIRFKADVSLEQLQAFVKEAAKAAAEFRQERRAARADVRGTFAGDCERYLELRTVQAMPSFTDRKRQIGRWKAVFGTRARRDITTRQIEEQLQAWRDAGDAAATVNKHRNALMSLWTRLDGRGAANPVRGTKLFEEPAPQPRGLPYDLIRRLLDAMPREMSQPIAGDEGSRARGSKTRVRFELMAWTGMTPRQIADLTPAHINIRERWYISPTRGKGARRPAHPRPLVRKPMTVDARRAFERFVALDAWGSFSVRSLRHSLERARKKVERDLRKERRDPAFTLPHIRPYDFRHSFGTELFRRTKDLALVAEMLDHASLQMTKRYAVGAMAEVLKAGMQQFQDGTRQRKRGTRTRSVPSPQVMQTAASQRSQPPRRATPSRAQNARKTRKK